MKPVSIAWSRQDKQLCPGAGDSLTAFGKMDIGGGYAAVLRYGSRRMRTSVSMSESTKQGSKSADLVQILAVCTNAARSTEAGQLRILISALLSSSFKGVLKIRSGTRNWIVPRSSKTSVSVRE